MSTEHTADNLEMQAISWSMLAHLRIAISELQVCQGQTLRGQTVCLAALLDAKERVIQAIAEASGEDK